MNLRPLAPPFAALAVSWVALVAFVSATVGRLPARIATHFGANGVANGWMTRSEHTAAVLILGFGAPLFILLVMIITRLLGDWAYHLPHRDYWLAPERREETKDFILRRGVWLGCLLVLFTAGIHWLIIDANAHPPIAMPGSRVALVIVPFLACVAVWGGSMILHFVRKP